MGKVTGRQQVNAVIHWTALSAGFKRGTALLGKALDGVKDRRKDSPVVEILLSNCSLENAAHSLLGRHDTCLQKVFP